jgi:hypothetical protein
VVAIDSHIAGATTVVVYMLRGCNANLLDPYTYVFSKYCRLTVNPYRLTCEKLEERLRVETTVTHQNDGGQEDDEIYANLLEIRIAHKGHIISPCQDIRTFSKRVARALKS